jgi:hypothetical protein
VSERAFEQSIDVDESRPRAAKDVREGSPIGCPALERRVCGESLSGRHAKTKQMLTLCNIAGDHMKSTSM